MWIGRTDYGTCTPECPEYCELRKNDWPREVTLNHKLYRIKEELQTAIKFIMGSRIGLSAQNLIITPDSQTPKCLQWKL